MKEKIGTYTFKKVFKKLNRLLNTCSTALFWSFSISEFLNIQENFAVCKILMICIFSRTSRWPEGLERGEE